MAKLFCILLWSTPFDGASGASVPWPIGQCVAPATCSPPAAVYSVVKPVPSRQQWLDSGGYCGALSVQAIAQSYGIWVSQDQIRKAVDNSSHGKMIMHYNIQKALDVLKLTHVDWDWKNSRRPQSEKYMAWLKHQLASGYPVIWMISTREFAAKRPGAEQALPVYTHIEPVWGLFSNQSLNDSTVYPDDVLLHGADYGANRSTEGPKLYRRFDSLVDNIFMTGNCSKAVPGVGHNEYYPCISKYSDFGYAVTGVAEPSSSPSLPLSLAVDRFDEPDFPWTKESPCQLAGTVTVEGLEAGNIYTLFRWDDYKAVPTDGDYENSDWNFTYNFTASGNRYVFEDPRGILSSGSTYYRCVRTGIAASRTPGVFV